MDVTPADSDVQRTVERGVRNALVSILGTIGWTIASIFAILVGSSFVLIGVQSPVGIGFAVGGVFVIGCSVYLLLDLYRPR